MRRTIRREILDEWINEAYPNALKKLSDKSDVPVNSISKIRNGRVPKSEKQRRQLAKAVGVKESELFPVLPDGEEQAS